jgi:DNA modification methylase
MKKRRAPPPRESRASSRPLPRPAKGVFDGLIIQSPKRTPDAMRGWDGFFPYYAGYPEPFARSVLASAGLAKNALVVDPWNGSGTTTFSASRLGLASQGFDINPVMLIVARARLLPRSEADSLEPLARKILKGLRGNQSLVKPDDPLLNWFTLPTATLARALERRIQDHFLGDMTLSASGVKLENISGLAATFYVALFSVCRHLAASYQSSNPTWLRKPRDGEYVIESDREEMFAMFVANLKSMTEALVARPTQIEKLADVDLSIADTASLKIVEKRIDFILTSPPYCTRIDYAAATRIELAVLHPLLGLKMEDLGRRMIGSTRVPTVEITRNSQWGPTCGRFLSAVKKHPSKASEGYYYKTHLDYFDKMQASLTSLGAALKDGGKAILVVRDSYYKDVHNDLAAITTEMGNTADLRLGRRVDFHISRSMAGVNPHSRAYRQTSSAVESVLCFRKS